MDGAGELGPWCLSGGGTMSGLAWQTGLLAGLQAGGADITRPDLFVGCRRVVAGRLACGHDLGDAFTREQSNRGVLAPRFPRPGRSRGGAAARASPGWSRGLKWPMHITAGDIKTGKLVVWTRALLVLRSQTRWTRPAPRSFR